MSKSAFDRLVGYLARRDHTIKELYQKLARYHEHEEIAEAMERAQKYNYLPDPKKMAERTADSLLRKGKGPRYVSAFLKKKGLPAVGITAEAELDRGRQLVLQKLRLEPPFSLEEKQKIFRYLCNRGFSQQTARKVMNLKGNEE